MVFFLRFFICRYVDGTRQWRVAYINQITGTKKTPVSLHANARVCARFLLIQLKLQNSFVRVSFCLQFFHCPANDRLQCVPIETRELIQNTMQMRRTRQWMTIKMKESKYTFCSAYVMYIVFEMCWAFIDTAAVATVAVVIMLPQYERRNIFLLPQKNYFSPSLTLCHFFPSSYHFSLYISIGVNCAQVDQFSTVIYMMFVRLISMAAIVQNSNERKPNRANKHISIHLRFHAVFSHSFIEISTFAPNSQ